MSKGSGIASAAERESRSEHLVLIVEDEFINLEMLTNMLEHEYDIIQAENGEEAIKAIEKNYERLSLVLLDLNLPGMHGFDILKRMRENENCRNIPVIVITSDKESEVESLNKGAIDFISKPYPMPEIVQARVRRIIELSDNRSLIRGTEKDQLTGLYNREFFYRYAEKFDARNQAEPTDAIVIDVNHFHMVNERYGKAYADDVLRRIGEALGNIIGGLGGIASRREADTFLVYCPHQEDLSGLLEKVTAVAVPHEAKGRIRLRLGAYSDVDKSIEIERRFDRAKMAADTVRSSYTGSIAVYDNNLHEKEIFRERLLEEFQNAVDGKQFRVFFQPKFDVRPALPLLCGAEALVRWVHPELGMISPGVFVPLFEENGLIRELDNYVWRTAAAQVREWKDRLGYVVPVSVNVSRIDMLDPELADTLSGLVAEYGLDYSDFHLEITESAYTQDAEQIINTVSRLRELGFFIEMDDFGSGYSSLNMISTLPIDALKLDMMFIRNAFSEHGNTRMLEVTFDISDSLSVPMIAEGVETAEQMLTLKAMGCDIVQGYYFAKPMPAEEFEAYLLERKMIHDAEGDTEKSSMVKKPFHEKFNYDALRDAATGLYNQDGFDMLYKYSDKEHIAVLLIHTEYVPGENMDQQARLVSGALRQCFRAVDLICRVRDDEFAVVVMRVSGSARAMIEDKIGRLNDTLSPVVLTAGAAFSDRENPHGDILRDAGEALQKARQTMDKGCMFY